MKNNRYINKRILSTDNLIEYLYFFIDDYKFAIGVSCIKQVLEHNQEMIFNVPSKQNYLVGKYNFRGQSIDLYNLKAIFNYNKQSSKTTIIIVLELNQTILAISVDRLVKIIRATSDEIKKNDTRDTHPVVSHTLMQEGEIIPILDVANLIEYVVN